MDKRVAYIMSQCVCAQARIEGMKAENAICAIQGEYPKYGEDDFSRIPDEFGLGCNTVLGYLQE